MRVSRASCAVCGARDTLYRCGRCRAAHYCGSEHQQQHWAQHRLECIKSNTTSSNSNASNRSSTPSLSSELDCSLHALASRGVAHRIAVLLQVAHSSDVLVDVPLHDGTVLRVSDVRRRALELASPALGSALQFVGGGDDEWRLWREYDEQPLPEDAYLQHLQLGQGEQLRLTCEPFALRVKIGMRDHPHYGYVRDVHDVRLHHSLQHALDMMKDLFIEDPSMRQAYTSLPYSLVISLFFL